MNSNVDELISQGLKVYWSKKCEEYAEIFAKDGLTDEIEIINEVLRWKPDPLVCWIVDQMNLNDFWYPNSKCSPDFRRDPISKNNPHIREMYRKMGYSISGYYEIFFWEANNPIASEWKGE